MRQRRDSLGQQDGGLGTSGLLLGVSSTTHSSILAWRITMDRGAWHAAVHRVAKSRTQLSDFTFTFHFHPVESRRVSLGAHCVA